MSNKTSAEHHAAPQPQVVPPPEAIRAAVARMDECRAGCDAGDPFYADPKAWDTVRAWFAAPQPQAMPVAEVEEWPNDDTSIGIVPLAGWSELPAGTKLYTAPQAQAGAEDVALVTDYLERCLASGTEPKSKELAAWQRIRADYERRNP